jgi:hypothetical protein
MVLDVAGLDYIDAAVRDRELSFLLCAQQRQNSDCSILIRSAP